MTEDQMPRRCRRVQAWLPDLVDGRLAGWKRRLAGHHVGRCERCAEERARQRRLKEGLEDLGRRRAGAEDHDPPEDLLHTILERAHDPGLRGRVAVPARGALSGARPELSVAAALLLLTVVYLTWRTVRALVELIEDD